MLRFSGDSVAGVERGYSTGCIYAAPERGIFILVDGDGEEVRGEQFASLILPLLSARLERETGSIEERIREAITLANNELALSNQTQADGPPLVCSIAAAVTSGTQATFGRVGATTAYLIEPRSINQITIENRHDNRDARRESGEPSSSSQPDTPRAGTREHEPEDDDFIDIIEINFNPENALLLSSPALGSHLVADEILRIVQRHPGNRARVVRWLTKAAIERGCEKSFSLLFVENEKLAPALRNLWRHEPQHAAHAG